MDIDAIEERLPRIGIRWVLGLGNGSELQVIAERSGRRLLGVRFNTAMADRPTAESGVVADTLRLDLSSPLTAQTINDVNQPGADAVVLAVIDDETPDVVEPVEGRRCKPGDRVSRRAVRPARRRSPLHLWHPLKFRLQSHPCTTRSI